MSETTLSVFVDESGIWNESESSSRYYIVAIVLHDQSIDISRAISSFDRDVASLGIVNLCFHATPIIRGNGTFEILSAELRRKIFSRMMGFARKGRLQVSLSLHRQALLQHNGTDDGKARPSTARVSCGVEISHRRLL